jgi:hydroxymethylbilane synthase
MNPTLTIGTRGSQLALWQAKYIKNRLNSHFPELQITLKIIKTTGDRIQDRSLVGVGKGVFTKEIELALLDGSIDLAVHSMKDLPTELPDGLCIGAIPAREDPRDVLVTKSGLLLDELPEGAKLGTGSPRRRAQLNFLRSDLQVADIRGNLDTRLRKLREGDFDGLILAAAGIKRLIGAEIITEYFEIDDMVPAPGQGALGIEIREADDSMREWLQVLNDPDSETTVLAERVALAGLGGGCQVPIGVNARIIDSQLHLVGIVCSPDGKQRVCEKLSGTPTAALKLGRILATKLIQNGAHELLEIKNHR